MYVVASCFSYPRGLPRGRPGPTAAGQAHSCRRCLLTADLARVPRQYFRTRSIFYPTTFFRGVRLGSILLHSNHPDHLSPSANSTTAGRDNELKRVHSLPRGQNRENATASMAYCTSDCALLPQVCSQLCSHHFAVVYVSNVDPANDAPQGGRPDAQ